MKTGKPLDRQDVLERLCKLQEEVFDSIGYDHPTDCICKKGGFWKSKSYGGTWEEGYRNDGSVLEFIEKTVRKALKKIEKKKGSGGIRDE